MCVFSRTSGSTSNGDVILNKKIYIPDIICLKITFAVSLSYLCVYFDHHFLSFAFIITNNIILRAEIIANHIKKI